MTELPFYLLDLPDSYEEEGFEIIIDTNSEPYFIRAGRMELLASAGDKTVAQLFDRKEVWGGDRDYPIAAIKDFSNITQRRKIFKTTDEQKQRRKQEQENYIAIEQSRKNARPNE